MPNPSLIAATKNNAAIAAANTSATVTSNGSVTAGNLQIVTVLVSGAIAPTGISPPDGTWTTFLATTTTEVSGAVSAAIFYKKATASGAFSGSFSWTTASTGGEWSFTEWSGCGAGLVDGTVGTSLTTGTSPASPAKTPGAGNVNDTLVCALFGGVLSTSTVAAPAGMSSILTVNGSATQPLFGLASLNLASASATATQAWTLGTGQNVLAVSFLLQQGPVWGFDGGGSGQGNAITMPAMPPTRQRVSATKGKSEFAIYSPPFPNGWEVQPPQPPHPVPEKRAAGIMRGDDGTEFAKVNYVPHGWPVQHVQPPHLFIEKRGAGIIKEDDGIEFTKIAFVAHGWPIQPWQPPHPRPERYGAIVADDDGTESPFALWRNFGWQVAPHQPQHPRPERGGSILAGEAGIEAKFSPPSTAPPFFDAWSHVQRAPQRLLSATRGRADFAIFAATAPWVEIQGPMVRQTLARGAAASGSSEFAAFALTPWWETPQPQPNHPRVERAGAIMVGDSGTEAKFAPPAVFVSWGYEPTFVYAHRFIKQPPFWDHGAYVPTPPFHPMGWEPVLPPPPRPRWEKSGGIARGDDGTEGTLIRFFTPGWEVQSPQPPHPRPERAGALMRGDDGVEAKFSFVAPILTWAYDQTNQHARRFARAPMVGDDGTALPFAVYRPIIEAMWPQPPHPRPERAGTLTGGWNIDFVAPKGLSPMGWEVQPPQPPRRLWERAAAIARGDEGDQYPLIIFRPHGWPIQPWQPPHPSPERRGGAFMRGDDGTVSPYLLWTLMGWEIQSHQPSHPRPERAGATAEGDQGVYQRRFSQVFYARTTVTYGFGRTQIKAEMPEP